MIPTWLLTLFPISSGVLYTKNQISVLLLVATTFHLFLLRGPFTCKGSMAISHHSLKKKKSETKERARPFLFIYIFKKHSRLFSSYNVVLLKVIVTYVHISLYRPPIK